MKTILFIIGSLRAQSFNRQLAIKAREIIGARAKVKELNYSDLPLLNQDVEQPEPAARRQQLAAGPSSRNSSPL